MIKVKKLVWVLLLSSFTFAGFLHREGTNIVKDGENLLLTGVNLGNWLLLEGYLWDIQGDNYDSEQDMINAITDLVGAEKCNTVLEQWRRNMVQEADVDSLIANGFNCIRLPFHYKYFYDKDKKELIDDGFSYIDPIIEYCRGKDITIILDMHAAPGGQNQDHHSDGDGTARLWSDWPENRDLTASIWKHIAKRYKDEEIIGGYDMLNEPVIYGEDWKLRNAYITITDSIRAVDNNHMVIAEGNMWSSQFFCLVEGGADEEDRWDENMAFSNHNYWTQSPNPQLNDQLRITREMDIPLWHGEGGENSNHWYSTQVKSYRENGVGSTWWTYKKILSITSPWSIRHNEGYWDILAYWKGDGSKPSKDDAYDALIGMTENLKIENCVKQKGVIDALTRTDYLEKNIPYTDITLPGTFEAAHYDLGANNVAYKDNQYECPAVWNNWNDGWFYRNDGVDVEGDWANSNSTKPWVSGIESGEWMKYSVDIKYSGEYRFSLILKEVSNSGRVKIKSEKTGEEVELNLNNNEAALDLIKGSDVLTLEFSQGGFSLQSIKAEMDGVASSVKSCKIKNHNVASVRLNNSKLSISIPESYGDHSMVRLRNHRGQIIQRKSVSSGISIIDMSNISQGVYILSIEGQKGARMSKSVLLN